MIPPQIRILELSDQFDLSVTAGLLRDNNRQINLNYFLYRI